LFNPDYVKDEYQQIMLQINGKLRGEMRVEVSQAMNREFLLEKALQEETITRRIGEYRILKKIAVPGKLVNIVIEL
jgi:leucyl-tRNA synthetase